jgi:hypothetical protein
MPIAWHSDSLSPLLYVFDKLKISQKIAKSHKNDKKLKG